MIVIYYFKNYNKYSKFGIRIAIGLKFLIFVKLITIWELLPNFINKDWVIDY